MDSQPSLAIAGFLLAFISIGIRSVLLQIDLLERQDALDALTRVDPLTGIANRRAFDQGLANEWSRARRGRHGIALLLADVDHFKQFNDQFGHQAGDRCLQAVAVTLSGCIMRQSDLVARYGGEEFAMILPATPLRDAMILAERMRVAIEALPVSPALAGVTISIGVATLENADAASHEELLRAADTALYEAKHLGRNRVVGKAAEPAP